MEPTVSTDAMSARQREKEMGHDAATTRTLLRCGVLAGPFYLAVGLIQALVRAGFDFARHPLSVLANGPGGWVQTANFALTGLLVLATAVGIGRVRGPKARGLTWVLAVFGAGLLAAALFPADPVDGFPPGTPEGPPTSISTTGLLHFVAGALTFLFLGISGLVAARAASRRNLPSLAWLSLASGLAVLIGFFGGFMLPSGIAGIWFAVVVGFAWLSFFSLRLLRLV